MHAELPAVQISQSRSKEIYWLMPWVRGVTSCFEMILLHQFTNSVGFFWATSEEFHRLLRYLPNVRSFKHGSHAFVIVSGKYLKVFSFWFQPKASFVCACVFS